MSQKTVQLFIGQLLTDEQLRERFLHDPGEALRQLRDLGYELSDIEMGALMDTDVDVWESAANRIHPWLQRCRLMSD
jgi:hypothetical protein